MMADISVASDGRLLRWRVWPRDQDGAPRDLCCEAAACDSLRAPAERACLAAVRSRLQLAGYLFKAKSDVTDIDVAQTVSTESSSPKSEPGSTHASMIDDQA